MNYKREISMTVGTSYTLKVKNLPKKANFARAFDLKKEIPDIEPHTRKYELGGVAYWHDGPSVAIFYRHKRKKTVVPVVTIGKVTSDVSVFRKYGGKIRIWKKYH